jgi:hypothetical protein
MKTEEILQTIKTFEETLKRYKADLEKNPSSTFYTGLVKNTEEYIIAELNKLNHDTPNN